LCAPEETNMAKINRKKKYRGMGIALGATQINKTS